MCEVPAEAGLPALDNAGWFGLFRKDRQDIIPLVGPKESTAIKKGNETNRVQLACAGSTISVASMSDGISQAFER